MFAFLAFQCGTSVSLYLFATNSADGGHWPIVLVACSVVNVISVAILEFIRNIFGVAKKVLLLFSVFFSLVIMFVQSYSFLRSSVPGFGFMPQWQNGPLGGDALYFALHVSCVFCFVIFARSYRTM